MLEVQDQGASSVVGKALFLVTGSQFLSVCTHDRALSLLIRPQSGPIKAFIYVLQTLYSDTVTLGLRISTCGLGQGAQFCP